MFFPKYLEYNFAHKDPLYKNLIFSNQMQSSPKQRPLLHLRILSKLNLIKHCSYSTLYINKIPKTKILIEIMNSMDQEPKDYPTCISIDFSQ
jgi:hypothetical protein